MAVNKRYTYVWHVGETASPFSVQVVNSSGRGRVDLETATFTLIDRVTSTILINAKPCQTVGVDGLLAYAPTAAEMQTACRFLAQFTATTYAGTVLPTIHVEGEIEENLAGTPLPTAPTEPPFSIATDIEPLHWWRADAVIESGGMVDSLVDQGSLPLHFAQVDPARAPLAVDVDGKTYLALDEAPSCFYTAGSSPDWNFLHDGSPYTIALVYQRTDPISNTEVILDTANMNQANAGCSLFLDFNSAQVQGPKFMLAATGGPNIPISLLSRVPKTDKECIVIRHYGSNTTVQTGSHTPNAIDAIMRRNGVLVSTAAKSNVNYSSADAFSPLTLGKQSAASTSFTEAHIYELIVDDKTWSDRQIQGYENYARTTYKAPQA